jgi:hypothetical protein
MSAEIKTVNGGDVSGTWQMGTTVNITAHVTVPAGSSLTIEEGCQIIFNEGQSIEFLVHGNLYCKGTEENPVLFSVAPNQRTEANRFAGFWGGIIFMPTCDEALIDYAIIEYTGGTIASDAPSLASGYKIVAGDPQCTILGGKVGGKYVITNSILRYSVDNPFYLWGGKYIIANNLIIAAGHTAGGDAFAPKSGCEIDACFNIIFAPNTNGLKLSSSGDGPTTPQGVFRTYNNTIINAGWRRNADKGGSIYVEKNAKASVFNNLMVNCKYLAQTPSWDADRTSVIDYNFYCSGTQQSSASQDNNKTAFDIFSATHNNYFHDGRNETPKVDEHSKIATSAGSLNPNFENYPFNTVALTAYEYDDSWDFAVQAGSPVLTGAYSSFSGAWTGLFVNTGLTVGGKEYKSPAPAARFGAFGTK